MLTHRRALVARAVPCLHSSQRRCSFAGVAAPARSLDVQQHDEVAGHEESGQQQQDTDLARVFDPSRFPLRARSAPRSSVWPHVPPRRADGRRVDRPQRLPEVPQPRRARPARSRAPLVPHVATVPDRRARASHQHGTAPARRRPPNVWCRQCWSRCAVSGLTCH